MNDRKKNGSYYTPINIADFVISYLLPDLLVGLKQVNFLEPSAGDGVFVQSLLNRLEQFPDQPAANILTIEREEKESDKIADILSKHELPNVTYACIVDDFLESQTNLLNEFHLICGNPPYINKKYLSKEQINRCLDINFSTSLPPSISNIWTAFVLRSAQLLTDEGIMAFVLPAEVLQVKYAQAVKQYLYSTFKRVEFFNFRQLIFDAKGQGTVLFIGYKKPIKEEGIYFTTIDDIEVLKSGKFSLQKQNVNAISVKEMHFDLSEDDLSLLYRIRKSLQPVKHFTDSKPGIVTAANSYFIINLEKIQQYGLQRFIKPIIQKGSLVNGKVDFTDEDFQLLEQSGIPTYVLDFNEFTEVEELAAAYLEVGKLASIPLRYKCSMRDRWYDIPNISTPADAIFFKRCHQYPKLIKNSAQVLVTDSAYKIYLKPNFDLDSFIYSFYNSFTLAFAELEGRHYGGGVLELTPGEFKQLPLPYTPIDTDFFLNYGDAFKKKKKITDILENSDTIILRRLSGVDDQVIARVQRIRQQLVNKRFRVELGIDSFQSIESEV